MAGLQKAVKGALDQESRVPALVPALVPLFTCPLVHPLFHVCWVRQTMECKLVKEPGPSLRQLGYSERLRT